MHSASKVRLRAQGALHRRWSAKGRAEAARGCTHCWEEAQMRDPGRRGSITSPGPPAPTEFGQWCFTSDPSRLWKTFKIAWRKDRHHMQAAGKAESNWIYSEEGCCLLEFPSDSFSSKHHDCAAWVSSWVPAWDSGLWPSPMAPGLPKAAPTHPRQSWATGILGTNTQRPPGRAGCLYKG